MNKSASIRTFVLRSTLVLALGVIVFPGVAANSASQPNIILIMSDDMGYSDIGCYGGEIETPNLDRLAADGLRFTQFYNTARCCPTRASLLTGLYPHQAGMGHMTYDGKEAGYEGDLSRNAVTIAEALKPAGYSTYMAGKWHVTRFAGPEGPKHNWPRQRGFDRFYGTITGAGSFFDPTTLTRDNTFITPENDPEYRPQRFYYTEAISDNVVKYLQDHSRQNQAKPFFMYVTYTAAHWPMHALPEDIAKYKGKYDQGYAVARQARLKRLIELGLIDSAWDLTEQAGDWEKVANQDWEARCMEVYAAMVDNMDQGIGRIMQELKRQEQLDNTLIFFVQDNGGCAEGMGRTESPKWHLEGIKPMGPDELQPNIWPPMRTRAGHAVLGGPDVMPGSADTYIAYGRAWANVSNTPFREYKHWVHEGGISTPLIVHWPRRIKARGEVRHQPGHLIDIMATCVDVAGAQYPQEFQGHPIIPLEGKSLAPAFRNQAIEREAVYWEHEGNRAIRVNRWKLVAKGPAGKWELYDMKADRTEMHDLAKANPARVKEMAAQWEAWAKRARVLPWIWNPPYGEVAKEWGSPEQVFTLKPGDDLPREIAPRLQGKGWSVTANISEMASDGVIIAQGGTAEGMALYLKNRRLTLAIRRAGHLTEVMSPAPLAGASHQVIARLNRDGNASLSVDGQIVARQKTAGPLLRMPIDGLQVGRDDKGTVGQYRTPFAFSGRIENVTLKLD